MRFTSLTLGSNHWERDKHFRKWKQDIPSSAVFDSFVFRKKV